MIQSSLLKSLWNIFLQRLYRDISTDMFLRIPSKPEICLQHIQEFTILSIQAKAETSTLRLLLYGSLQLSVTHFYKYIEYYVID